MITHKFIVKTVIIAAIFLNSSTKIFAGSEGCMGCHQGEVTTPAEESQTVQIEKDTAMPAKVD